MYINDENDKNQYLSFIICINSVIILPNACMYYTYMYLFYNNKNK